MKNLLFIVDFQARIKNRKPMKDKREETRVCKVVRNVLKGSKTVFDFYLLCMVTEMFSFEFHVNSMVQATYSRRV